MLKKFYNRLIIIIYSTNILDIAEGQCDACPPGIMTVSLDTTINPSSAFQVMPFDSIPLPNEFKAIYAPDLRFNPIILNQSALSLLQFFHTPASLHQFRESRSSDDLFSDAALKKLIELNLLRPSNYPIPQFTENNDDLTVSLHLADACNLSCDYCYLPKTKLRMSLETGFQIIDKVMDSAACNHYKKIKIKYTGGEPLSDFSLISQLHRYAENAGFQNQIEISGSVLSNGTLLTLEIVEQIKALNLRLMISLDGIQQYHDCHRHFPDGFGSFTKVSHAIDMALSRNLIPDISATVSTRNIAGLPELLHWILERDLPFSINFYRENQQSRKYADLRLEEEKIIQGMLDAYNVIESNLPRRSLLASLADRANLSVPHLRPCSAGHSYMVFDCKGNISKCQMDTPVTDIRNPHPLKSIRDENTGLRNLSVDDKEECRSCKWRYWCGGGCPLEIYRHTGRYDRKSPNCNIYKALFPEIIRLEGLRLLRYEKPLEI